MAPLVFQFGEREIPVALEKVDRSKLYGSVRTEVTDLNDRPCRLATLAGDGRTLVEAGGLAHAYMSEENVWFEKAALHAVDREGRSVEPVASSFKAPVPLGREVAIEEYLNHNVCAVYLLRPEAGYFDEELGRALSAGKILAFEFSYRGGLSADPAFLLAGADGTYWMAVAKRSNVEFVGPDQVATVIDDEDAPEEESDDEMDFSMM